MQILLLVKFCLNAYDKYNVFALEIADDFEKVYGAKCCAD